MVAALAEGGGMMGVCGAYDAAGPLVGQVLALVDCQTQGIAQKGWQALSGFGGWLSGLLVIAVALMGYRLMLGERIGLSAGAGLVLRVGVVLALCTQWAAWDALAYRVGTQGPEALAAAVLGTDQAGLAARLDRLGMAMDAVAAVQDRPGVMVLGAEEKRTLASAQALVLGGGLAGLVAVRALVALLLAVGPLFVAGALFDHTRGLLAGWLRAMVGGVLAAVAVPMVLGMELAVVEPQVARLAAMVGGLEPMGPMVTRLWTCAGLFAAVLVAVALGAMRTGAFRFADGARVAVEQRGETMRQEREMLAETVLAPESRNRAQRIADSMMQAQRREERAGQTLVMRQEVTSRAVEAGPAPVRLGQAGRRVDRRVSPGAARRDGAA